MAKRKSNQEYVNRLNNDLAAGNITKEQYDNAMTKLGYNTKTADNVASSSLAGSNDNKYAGNASVSNPDNRATVVGRDQAQVDNNAEAAKTFEQKAKEESEAALGNKTAQQKVADMLKPDNNGKSGLFTFDTSKEEQTAAEEGKAAQDAQKSLDDHQDQKNKNADDWTKKNKNKDFLDSLSMATDQYGNPLVNVTYDESGKATISPTKTMSRQDFYKAYGSSPSKLRSLFGSLLTAAQGVGAFFGIPPVASGDKIIDALDKEGAKANIDREEAYTAYKDFKNKLNSQITDATGQAASTLIQNKANADATKTNAADEGQINALRKLGVEEADLKDYSDKLNQIRERADNIFKGNQDKDFAAYQAKLNTAQQEEIAAFMQDLANSAPTDQIKKLLRLYDNDPAKAAYIRELLMNGDPSLYISNKAANFGVLTNLLGQATNVVKSDKKIKSFVMPKLWT